jgi:phosphoribosylformylglycinamidine synthase
MDAAVIVFPGSNCDRDIKVALAQSMGKDPYMVWHRDSDLPKVDLIVLPGGFSYGDYLRCGAMAAHSPVMREVVARAKQGTRVLAICNGFQIATEAGLLPGALMRNAHLQYVCGDMLLRIETNQTEFMAKYRPGQVVRIPVGHADGNYQADPATLDRLEGEGLVALRYCDPNGGIVPAANPNGAARNIAGVYNDERNVLGLMPHPERLSDPALGGTDGRLMIDSLVEALS